jgi:DUF2075 family protein
MTGFSIERLPFESQAINTWVHADQKHANWPVVYTISSSKEIYIGETVNAASRMQQHLGVPERRVLERVQIIKHDRSNKSACLDLESHLIKYFAADGKFKVLNGNLGLSDANYFEREAYRESFKELFDLLVEQGFLSKSVPEIVNSDLFKYSPFKTLNSDQAIALTGILERLFSDLAGSRDDELVIRGEPGTGKTIIAIYLIKLLKDIGRYLPDELAVSDSVFSEYFTEHNKSLMDGLTVGLVIPQQSLRKTVQRVFASVPGLSASQVMSPFELGKSPQTFDLIIVDETHRLGQRANQSSAAQNTDFKEINEKLFGEDKLETTQLDWVRAKSRKRILLLDAGQSVRPADLPNKTLQEITQAAEVRDALFNLSSQMRVAGGNDYLTFVASLFGTNPAKAEKFGNYDLKFFDSFVEMRNEIQVKDKQYGLSRLLAGFAWRWKSRRDKSKHDIEIEGLKLFWNGTATDWINSKGSSEEVGSIHTVQGYDLNYAGVIIGGDLKFDAATQTILFDRSSYFDTKGKENNKKLGRKYSNDDIRHYVINIYKVLLTRGIQGTYVYVVDPALRQHLRQFF